MSEERIIDDFCRDRAEVDVSDDFTDRVMASVRADRTESAPTPLARVLAIAAASAAVVVFAFRVASVLSLFSG